MLVKDVMTPRVISVEPSDTLTHAIHLMLQNRISGLPVMDSNGKLVGILSEGDLLRRREVGTMRRRPRWLEFLLGPGRLAEEYVHATGRTVKDVMTTDVLTIDENASLDEAVALMEKRGVKRLPVTRRDAVVGILTRANLVHGLAVLALEAKPTAPTDFAIRSALLDELEKQPWAPVALVNVTVRNGIVGLWGTILDERQRQALITAAENMNGVRGVEDHLVWVEPTSGWMVPAG